MDTAMTERWRPVIGYESIYEVSDAGRVRNIKTGHMKKPTTDKKDGRLFLLLWKDGKATIFRVSRIVLTSFVGKCPIGFYGCHNDGDPSNNKLSNLRWDTPSSNRADTLIHGTANIGERCGTAKLTEKQVLQIIKDERIQSEIAKEYGVMPSTISRIKSGVRWGHLRT
jgi:hypothetical protein